MNKKILFLIFLSAALILPFVAQAAVPSAITKALANIKSVVTAVGYAMAVIGFIVAGVLYLFSAGAPEKMQTAKKAAIAAVIGSSLVALSTGTELILKIIAEILGAR